MNCFLRFNPVNILDELRVVVVINIWEIFLFFSNFSIKGTMLKSSPTLEQWNQINFPFFLNSELNAYLSRNLDLFSFFLEFYIKLL